jgi:hypothetical protein
MGIFDIFTNKNAQDAANIQAAGAQQAYGDLSKLYGQAGNALTTNYTQALQPFLQAQQTGKAGTTALTDALGITGDPTQVQARLAATPGYQFQLDQGNENILRNQAATGQLNSGKTNLDLQRFGQGLADTTYQQYVQNLQPFLGYNLSAAGGGAGVQTGLGSGLAGLDTGQAQAAYGADTSAANAQANAELAKNQGSANLWGLLGNIGKLGVSGAGGGGGTVGGNLLSGVGSGLGSLGSGLGSMFAMFSDERLKDDIAPVGKLFDGQNVYSYRYKGDDTPRIGLMAQEVEKRTPEAVVEIGGYKAVDYGRATEFASKLARFLDAA